MAAFLVAIKENGAATVKEPGCRQLDIMVEAKNPNHVFLYEVYDNEAALTAHRNTDHSRNTWPPPERWSRDATSAP